MRPVIRARFRPGAARSGHKRLTCRFSLKTEKSTAMKKMFVTVACALLSLAAFAQQSVKSDEGKPLVFSKAEFVGNLTVRMIRSDTARIEIKQSQSESNRLDWGVKDGNLFVKLKPGMNGKASSAEVVLYYDSLQALKASAANVAVEGPVCCEVLSVDLAAGATLGMDVATTDLYMKVAGNSAANITGTTKYYTLFATSKAKVDSRTLEAMDVRVEAASGAEAYVCATERLQMTSDTGAAIFYRGEPSIVRSSAKMMGTINSIGQ